MCGIVGAVATADVLPVLVDGLRRLEYRGYDSAGLALLDGSKLVRIRSVGKVQALVDVLGRHGALPGTTGLAHTRWATHGPPTEANAHPHTDPTNRVAVVCNGIIDNHETLRAAQQAAGAVFTSDTDTEVIAHEIQRHIAAGLDLGAAVKACVAVLTGTFAFAVISTDAPGRLVAVRRGSPLVVGVVPGATYVASDMVALIAVTRDFFVLENGDLVDLDNGAIRVEDRTGRHVTRPQKVSHLQADAAQLGDYRHYMCKEIHEQSTAIANTLAGRITTDALCDDCFGAAAKRVFAATKSVQIIACGSSYHAGLVARYWFEQYGVPCQVEIASEFHSRAHAVASDCLVVTISQSGETIDTQLALEYAKSLGYRHSLAICNVPESSLVRESELVLLTQAGQEIGVASTKAFTTQLVALQLLVMAIGRHFAMSAAQAEKLVKELRELPTQVEHTLDLEPCIQQIAEQLADKQHALFLGRGAHFPIAREGALKLKEVSYIHAEAYPAGELKHGPLALVDNEMPVIAVAPNDQLLGKLKSNIEEVRARGGALIVFTDAHVQISDQPNLQVTHVGAVDNAVAPIIYTIPLQLLAYHVALIKGTDVDKPRNLAKSVTVE